MCYLRGHSFNTRTRVKITRLFLQCGLDYIFTLSNASQEDAGIYEVVVEGTHPDYGSLITFKKRFHLNIIGILKL